MRLLYVLVLFEAGMSLLSTLGGTLFMGGDPWYLGVGLAVAALYIAAGQAASRGRRWGLLTILIAECLRLTGFGLSTLIGLTPWVQVTLTGASVLDSLILPAIVAVVAAVVLINTPRTPARIDVETLELVA
jgi:hypothetical protein